MPTAAEQQHILDEIRGQTGQLAVATATAQGEVDLLREYRTRLIADVVTGKLDVREAAASLLEEADERDPLDEGVPLESAEELTCPAVERRPEKLSGAWVFQGTRVPVSALFENLKEGASTEQFLDWFPGVEEWQVKAVLEHEMKSLAD